MRKNHVLALVLVCGFFSAVAAGAQRVVMSPDGNCKASIPGGWIVDAANGRANSADMRSIVSVDNDTNTKTIAELKATLTYAFPEMKILSETATELWTLNTVETPQGMRDNIYRALKTNGGMCTADFSYYDQSMAGTAKNVVGTLKGK